MEVFDLISLPFLSCDEVMRGKGLAESEGCKTENYSLIEFFSPGDYFSMYTPRASAGAKCFIFLMTFKFALGIACRHSSLKLQKIDPVHQALAVNQQRSQTGEKHITFISQLYLIHKGWVFDSCMLFSG